MSEVVCLFQFVERWNVQRSPVLAWESGVESAVLSKAGIVAREKNVQRNRSSKSAAMTVIAVTIQKRVTIFASWSPRASK